MTIRRFLPASLLGQMILLMGAALLVAQIVNFAFVLNREQTLQLAQNEGPAISQFVEVAGLVVGSKTAERRDEALGRYGRRFRAYTVDPASVVPDASRDEKVERRLSSSLIDADIDVRAVRAMRGGDIDRSRGGSDKRRMREGRWRLLLLSAQLPDGTWLNGRVPAPRGDPWLVGRLALATLALYVLVFGAMLWIASRIARPLGALTRAAESFQGRQDVQPVEPAGPSDVRRAVEAFNAMNRRVLGLLDEKDRMLGAIGHDLRTPLASLRIRAEGMEPEEEREALVRTVQEMTDTLEDILVLARTGRAREPARPMDVAALVDAVVEELLELGVEVTFEESARAALPVQPNLLRRAVRNLIDNAVAYGDRARVRVVAREGSAVIEVDDDGPGIPADRVEGVLKPFERLEGSRNRETGGSGLGLAIVKAIAESHGGELRLENRPEGGLRASLVLPA